MIVHIACYYIDINYNVETITACPSKMTTVVRLPSMEHHCTLYRACRVQKRLCILTKSILQCSNWMNIQGLTEYIRPWLKINGPLNLNNTIFLSNIRPFQQKYNARLSDIDQKLAKNALKLVTFAVYLPHGTFIQVNAIYARV